MAYLGCAEQEVETIGRTKRNNLLQRTVLVSKETIETCPSAAGLVASRNGATWSRALRVGLPFPAHNPIIPRSMLGYT